MTQHVSDVMTTDLMTVEPQTSVTAVAEMMRDEDIGAVLVTEGDRLRGLVTDRDLVVRSVAAGHDPGSTTVVDACSDEMITVSPGDDLDRAVAVMREHAVRRVPVVDRQQHPVGLVSLGDLAIERDPGSALGDISAAGPNT
ncbi:CBS domain-containing protein [Streptomyces sp. NPDC000983]|uniref:CBS domain-containing protein n=1 Tax=Streptomyces sp. NPDC000983 TaxID=3154373 RepID=UPI003319A6C8